ncbi:MAG: hypothetical protein DWQ07_18620 [Chloroflexi bacterium]|nr:MAG: hypothetical protein DWQ07_18620 [Chloroflexota bacterium]MBL1194946.1 hypothetical protein [Chloroflexota bacterium]
MQVQSWYGLPARIAVENELWHLVEVGGVALHHPPVVNLILRRGMPTADRLYLSYLHEFGHLQTLPVAIAHALILTLIVRWRGRKLGDVILNLLAGAIAHEAVWELASEAYVIAKTGPEYRRIYQQAPNLFGQAVFWGGMSTLALLLTAWVMRGK